MKELIEKDKNFKIYVMYPIKVQLLLNLKSHFTFKKYLTNPRVIEKSLNISAEMEIKL